MHDTMFTGLEPQTLRSNVVDVLRRAILSGEYGPGAAINQADIAKQLGISRGPLREALSQLQEEGLIRILPYKGAYVTDLSEAYIEELYSLRSVLEGFAARRAVAFATPAEVTHLYDIVARMRIAAEQEDHAALAQLDLEFHRSVCLMAHHTLLMQQWKAIEHGIQRCVSLRHSIYDDPIDVVGTHPNIVAAIHAGDGERAAALMEQHILDAGEILLRAWAAQQALEA
jgi:GntR family transcriptional regulator, gluconate operon transcriptional repressor